MSRIRGHLVCECGRTFKDDKIFLKHKAEEKLYDASMNDDHICPLCHKNKRVFMNKKDGYRIFCIKCCHRYTKESFLIRYGKEDGAKRWDDYCSMQSRTNTFEFKKKKFGWTREQFDEYNKSRAVTKENQIKKYGEKEGIRRFEEYSKRQSYTKKLPYFIEKYGKKEGKKKYDEVNKMKTLIKENFIRKYGQEDGIKKYEEYVESRRKNQHYWSKISKEFFDKLVNRFNFSDDIHYANGEIGFLNESNGKFYKYDFTDSKLKIIIEFNGECFHARSEHDPNFRNWIHPEQTAEESWKSDQERANFARSLEFGYFIVWETDYYKNSEECLNNMVEQLRSYVNGMDN